METRIDALILVMALLSSCRHAPPGPVATIAIAPLNFRLPVGRSLALTAQLRDSAGDSVGGRTVIWSTTDASLANVNEAGVVTGLAPGNDTVIATSEGHSASAQVAIIPVAITSTLRLSPTNPRYFTDATGRAVYLTGAHTWENFQDDGLDGHLRKFDWDKYLDFLVERNLNFTELWRSERAKWIAGFDSGLVYSPMPYLRTGPGIALDGEPKFDLTKFDQAYFDRMRQRVAQAGQRGIYVSIMLFDGWSIERKGDPHGNPWPGHPFNRANNINGIDGDPDRDGQGLETHTLQIPAVSALQDAYVRKVIDAVDDLDNVLYEVSNESSGGKAQVDWQYHIIALIKAYEAAKGKQHPVGMTALWPNGQDIDLFASGADFVSPAGKSGISDTPPANGKKVLIWDTDHLCGNCGDGPWAWRSFTRGVNPVFMDVYDAAYPVIQRPKPGDPRWEDARRNMGYTLDYALRMNLLDMTPRGDLASTGYCLASPGVRGAEYLVYLNGARSVKVNLESTPGRLIAEWFNPSIGRAASGGSVVGGGKHVFKAPKGAQVLYLRN